MPAVTADPLELPRIPAPTLGDVARPVRSLSTAPTGMEGEGFPVRRAFAGVDLRDLDPFLHMDQLGAVEYAPGEPRGTSWHPHRGFETVTYMLDGTFQHQDSHGGGGVIENGATQWMTAGAGILHIETPPEALVMSGGLFHGVQLWVNLPAAQKFAAPAYQSLEAGQVRLLSSQDGGALVRVIGGELAGHRGPGSTRTPINVVHATVAPGARLAMPWPQEYNALVYVLAGAGFVGGSSSSAGAAVRTGQLTVLGAGDYLAIAGGDRQQANMPALEVLVLGGRPIREPIAQYGPFVMNTREQVIEAMQDFQAGRLGVIPENALMPHVYRG
ncbi:MAG: pirin family protein [Actinomycetota bacterium]|nr:pirin family protein [Actinomycetota bacterium]